MSAFTQGLNFGFAQGMFNNMFGFGGFGGFWGNPFGCCCSPSCFMSPLYMVPRLGFGFMPYVTPEAQVSFPTLNIPQQTYSWNDFQSAPVFNNNFNLPQTNYSWDNSFNNGWGSFGDTFMHTSPSSASSKTGNSSGTSRTGTSSLTRNDNDFDIMMNYIFEREGGYNPNDCGQPGNFGVLQSSYDKYRKQQGLPTQHVSKLTKDEARDLYYQNYYLASGADKITNPILAMQVFDAAVNMGVGTAKELRAASGDDVNKFEELRIARYERIAENNPDKKKYLEGWKRRVSRTHDFANKELVA